MNESNKKPTVTIGIPAYNEEANIKHLLISVLKQDQSDYKLLEIIVISDGSTDKTVEIANSLNNPLLDVTDMKENMGIAKTQNMLCEKANGDILVMLDADVLPDGYNFINEIIKPVVDNKADLVGADTISMLGRNFFEKIIANSHEFKQYIYRQINNSNSVYLCHGRARAFSKKLYKTIKWPVPQHGEDAYSYFFAISKGFGFIYQPSARVFFRSPATPRNHAIQSQRFMNGQKVLEKDFSVDFVRKNYVIPKKIIIKATALFLIKKPVDTFLFIILHLFIRFLTPYKKKNFTKWEPSQTSKKLI